MIKTQAWLHSNCRFANLDLNFWISSEGQTIPAPNASHSGVAAQVIKERDGVEMDPTAAYRQLLKEGWIRVSDFMFELVGHDSRKQELIRNFLLENQDYYASQPTIEIDDNAGESRQYDTAQYMAGEAEAGGDLPVGAYNPPPTSNFYPRWGD